MKMRMWNRRKFRWKCPMCGLVTKTYIDVAPLCRGEHLVYVMNRIKDADISHDIPN